MDAHGGYLWVGMCVVGSEDMVGHGNEARSGIVGRCGKGFTTHDVDAKYTSKLPCRTGVPMVTVLTGG